ncbi:MAG: hypothetical protein ABR976_06885 [Terracidiphilus sp.]|jgi:hypothetical protein
MNPIEYHLKLTISLWCGANPTQYTIDSQLRDIWTAHVPGLAYEPVGIQRFMYQMYADPLFGACSAAHNMTPGEFVTGGDLQTVRSVYVRLLGCGTGPIPAQITSDVPESWGVAAE